MTRSAKWLVGLSILSLAAGLVLSKPVDDWDRAVDFSQFKTYAWQEGTPADNILVQDRLVYAISLELAACGLPSLVVPLGKATDDHQVPNAIAYSKSCGALWSREADWDPSELAAAIADQLRDPKVWTEKSRSASQIAQPHAAKKLVDDCEAMMTGHW